jgi:hypothetical protein
MQDDPVHPQPSIKEHLFSLYHENGSLARVETMAEKN